MQQERKAFGGRKIVQSARRNSASVTDTIATHIRDSIVKGSLHAGTALPSERNMMEQFDVSRTTVREALRMLGAQGFVEIKRGRSGGAFVSNQTGKFLQSSLDMFLQGGRIKLIDIVFVREALEPAAAAQAAMCRTEEQVEELRRLSQTCEDELGDIAGFTKANLAWHLGVARASDNPLFVAFMNAITTEFYAATDREEFDLTTRKAVVGVHWQIFDAIAKRDPDAARRRMIRHLNAYGERLTSIDFSKS